MKIVFVVRWHSANMGYINNFLPQAFAKMGHEVHLITSQFQSYYNVPNYKEIYENFLGPPKLPAGLSIEDGVSVRRLKTTLLKNQILITGLYSAIKKIDPDIIQTFDIHEIHTFKLNLFKPFFRYKLFTGNHTSIQVFRNILKWDKLTFANKLKWSIFFYWPSKIFARNYEVCYAVTRDAQLISHFMYGAELKKVKISCLGVNSDFFNDTHDANIIAGSRKKMGYSPQDIICVFTGKFNEEKNPELICKAVELLNKTENKYKALFIGSGILKEKLKSYSNTVVVDYLPVHELPAFYKMADMAIWPSSITTSIIDAAACATPVIVSDRILAYGSAEKNASKPQIISEFYNEGNAESLALAIKTVAENKYSKMRSLQIADFVYRNFSWDSIAKRRMEDYTKAITSKAK